MSSVQNLAYSKNELTYPQLNLIDLSYSSMDTMQLFTRVRRPELYISFECNPEWREIVEALPNGDVWQQHPDVVARIFRMKSKSLIDTIMYPEASVPMYALVYRVEWQKRGLPRVHILLIM